MITPAHTLSVSIIAVTVLGIAPTQTNYILASLIFASFLDLDHIYYFIKDHQYFKTYGYKGQLQHARSPLHEPLGFVIWGIIALLIAVYDTTMAKLFYLCTSLHMIEDFIVGISYPFSPYNMTEYRMFNISKQQMIYLNSAVIFLSLLFWQNYFHK